MTNTLSKSQKKALEQLEFFYLDPMATTFLLAGSAGTGKTYLLKEFLLKLPEFNQMMATIDPEAIKLNPYITATTNKAVAAIEEIINGTTSLTHYELSTIYSQMGLKLVNDYKTGEQKLTKTNRLVSQPYSLVVIDECSMVSKELLQYIKGTFIGHSKIIYIGDPYQLPPVKEKISSVFAKTDYRVELLEPQRQLKDSSILTLANQFRNIIRRSEYSTWPNLKGLDPDVLWTEDSTVFLHELEHQFDPETDRILAWTNQTVRNYNTHLRWSFGYSKDFQIGEQVTLADSCYNYSGTKLLRGDSIFTIQNIYPSMGEYCSIKNYKVYSLKTLKSGYIYEIYVPDDYNDIKKAMKVATQIKDWNLYFKLKENFADLRSIYASTVHKSQGSTFDKVFIDLNDISQNTKKYEIARLLYVAISRARKQVILYGNLRS